LYRVNPAPLVCRSDMTLPQRGQYSTAHYAICTGFMALGLMLPGMWSGWLQDHIGYKHFFAWVIVATIPGFWVAARVPLEENFGKKVAAAS